MRSENLIHFTSNQSREKAVENGRKGGRKSGESRRKRKAMKRQMDYILSKPIKSEKIKSELMAMGVDEESLDNMMLIALAVYKKALFGDMKAVRIILDLTGENATRKVIVETKLDEKVQELEDYLLNEREGKYNEIQ